MKDYVIRHLQWDISYYGENRESYRAASRGYNCVYYIEANGDDVVCSKLLTGAAPYAKLDFDVESIYEAMDICQEDFEKSIAAEFLFIKNSPEYWAHILDDSD